MADELPVVASQVLADMRAQGVLIEWQTALSDALTDHTTATARIAELRAECDKANAARRQAQQEAADLKARIATGDIKHELTRLGNEVEALRKDAERLDWLETQRMAYGFQEINEGNEWKVDGPFATARAAIDAAIQAQKGASDAEG